jgi:dienelactone hydrolase
MPVGYAVYLTHLSGRRAVHDADLGRPKLPVALRGAQGVVIRGWYVPSRNRAAVIPMHGTGSNRNGVAAHARVLARHGYGVLALDLRGHGDSGGRSTSVPWKLDDDLDAAIAWLSRRSDVDDRRIGALGVSLGGVVALRAAARRTELRAIGGTYGGPDQRLLRAPRRRDRGTLEPAARVARERHPHPARAIRTARDQLLRPVTPAPLTGDEQRVRHRRCRGARKETCARRATNGARSRADAGVDCGWHPAPTVNPRCHWGFAACDWFAKRLTAPVPRTLRRCGRPGRGT